MFLVEESLHDESGLTPLLSCAEVPHASVCFCEKSTRKVVYDGGKCKEFYKCYYSSVVSLAVMLGGGDSTHFLRNKILLKLPLHKTTCFELD